MNRKKSNLPRIGCGVLAMALWLAPAAVRADVRDGAGIFSPQAVRDADATIRQMDQRYHKDLVVETYKSIPADLQGEFQSKGKDAFFAAWTGRRAAALKVNGVMVLVCMEPGHLQVESGAESHAKGIFTAADDARVRQEMVAAFKTKDYDRGLSAAVQEVDRTFTANVPAASTPAVGQRQAAPQQYPAAPANRPATPAPSHGFRNFGMGTLLCLGLGIVIIIALVRSVFGSRNRGNPGGGNFGGGPGIGGPGVGGTNYTTGGPNYGGGGYNAPQQQQRGGGFGTGLLGGLLGGAVGGYAADKFEHRNDAPAGGNAGGGASSGGDFSGGGASSGFDSGPSDAGQGFADNSSGGDFGGGSSGGDSGGGGDFGGGGGDSGGGGGDF